MEFLLYRCSFQAQSEWGLLKKRGWNFNLGMDGLRVQWKCFLWPPLHSRKLLLIDSAVALRPLFYHQLGGLNPLRQLAHVLSSSALFTRQERAISFHLNPNDTSLSLCGHVPPCQLRCHATWKESVFIQAVSRSCPRGINGAAQLFMDAYLKMQRSSCHLAHSPCSGSGRRSRHETPCFLSVTQCFCVTRAPASRLRRHLPLASSRLGPVVCSYRSVTRYRPSPVSFSQPYN